MAPSKEGPAGIAGEYVFASMLIAMMYIHVLDGQSSMGIGFVNICIC